jgi:hypothetical protein
MTSQPSYRTLAGQNLEKSAGVLNGFPKQGVPPELAQAHFAHAQVIATIAVAQALLDLGDVLREGFTRSGFDVEVD